MMMKNNKAFALIEILIALTILSNVLLVVYSSVSSGIHAMSGNTNRTKAMIIAKSSMIDFISERMRLPDISGEPVEDNQNFSLTRVTEPYENRLLGQLATAIRETTITVSWKERGKTLDYTLNYIYMEQ